jgi:hypothetical protein
VEKAAWPAPFSAALPSVIAPSRKETEPVGVPGATDVTVAVKFTLWPKTEGFTFELTVDVVGAGLTVCGWPAEVEALKFVSLEYVAVIV